MAFPIRATREKPACKVCEKTGNTLRCGKCLNVSYCSKECQAKDWKSGHKAACKSDPSSETSAPKPRKASRLKIEKPFTRLEHNIFLHDLSDEHVYILLIDSFRMRQEDLYKHQLPDADSIYCGAKDSLIPFSRYLDEAEKKPEILPAWWNKTKRAECIELGKGGHEWVDLSCCVEKDDVEKHYGDDLMPMKLRMLAESFLGIGPWGTPATPVRRMMMSMEG
jgi:splicing suppressor protein 51